MDFQPLLAPNEEEAFTERYSRYSRSLLRCNNTGQPEGSDLVDLTQPVKEYLGASDGQPQGFRCLAVSAALGDGVTWAAAVAFNAGAAMLSPNAIVALKPTNRTRPEIFECQWLSRHSLAQAARRSGITTSFRISSPWVTAALIAAAVALAVAASLVTALFKSATPAHITPSSTFASPSPLLYAVILAVVGLGSQTVTTWLKADPDSRTMTKLAKDVNDQIGSDNYWKFIDLLAVRLTSHANLRCLIVDDFTRLDRTSADLLVYYLFNYANERRPELWVVFDHHEQGDASLFRKEILNRRNSGSRLPPGLRATRLYDMVSLTPEKRLDLARLVGHPERASYRTIKAIVSESDDTLVLYFSQRSSAATDPYGRRRDQTWNLLYALALTAAYGENISWDVDDLISRLSNEKVRRTHVLKAVLPDSTLSGSQLSANLSELAEGFSRVITLEKRRHSNFLSVDPQAFEALENIPGRNSLPRPGLVHLFWGLYWHDLRGNKPYSGLTWLKKRAVHLQHAEAPSDLGLNENVDDLTQDYIDALIDTAESCLQALLLKYVSPLLERAHLLIAGNSELPRHRGNRRRLLRSVRDAFSVLGDATLLRIIFYHPQRKEIINRDSLSDSLVAMYAQAIGASLPDGEWTRWASGAREAISGFRRYAELNGAWLALSAEPFVLSQTKSLQEAAQLARKSVTDLTKDSAAVGELMSEDRGAADFITLSLGLWCSALACGSQTPSVILHELKRILGELRSQPYAAGDETLSEPLPVGLGRGLEALHGTPDVTGETPGAGEEVPSGVVENLESTADDSDADIVDSLESAYLISAELRKRRFDEKNKTSLDFVLDCIAEELLVITVATAVYASRQRSGPGKEQADQLDHIVTTGLRDLDLAVTADDAEVVEALARRLALIQATWNGLGCEHLAASLNIRIAQFSQLRREQERSSRNLTSPTHALAVELGRSDLLGLLANLSVAGYFSDDSKERSAQMIVRAALCALDGDMGEELCTQLCMLGIGNSYGFSTDKSKILEYLIQPSETDVGLMRLRRVLDSIGNDQLDDVLRWIVAILAQTTVDEETVISELQHRASRADPETRRFLDESLEIYRLEMLIDTGTQIDADEVLTAWTDRKTSPRYPFLLYLLLRPSQTDTFTTMLVNEATNVLEDFRTYVQYSGIVLLADRIARTQSIRDRTERFTDSLLAEVLSETLDEWEANLPTNVSMSVLRFLREHDPAHSEDYTRRLWYRTQVELEGYEIRRLPELLRQGRNALIFLYYWRLFSYHHPLPTEYAPIEANDNDLSRFKLILPAPFVSGKLVLSGMFIRDAIQIFETELSDDPNFEDVRRELNESARRELPKLYQLLIELPGVPDNIRTMLRRHRAQAADAA